ncbi:MAG: type I methionyl aminopeptidase [Deltaproteobacteria bacterium]|nr:type I methionyl aminopeptidase [Deltaproteobacteria bacterium]
MGREEVILKSRSEIEKLRTSNLLVAEILEILKGKVSAGITTMDLEGIADGELKRRGAHPAFKGYRGYPYCLCTSVNEEVVHGMPSVKRVLKEGDILSIDFGVCLDGYYGDAAATVAVGIASPEAIRLIEATSECLERAIPAARVGGRLYDISHEIQSCAEKSGYSVVRDFVGHGIGRSLHEPPEVPNFGRAGTGPRLKEGMVLAIEPMVNEGGSEVRILADGWTAVTADGKLSAHFEHSVAITEDGPYVLSRL